MQNKTTVYTMIVIRSVQFISVTQSCPSLRDPMNCSNPGLPVHHQLPEFTQTHVHRVGDAIQPSHPLSSPSPPAPNPSQHQSLLKSVSSSHEVAKVLEFQHHSFQRTPRALLRIKSTRLHMKQQPAPAFLPGESHGDRSLVGCSPWGH